MADDPLRAIAERFEQAVTRAYREPWDMALLLVAYYRCEPGPPGLHDDPQFDPAALDIPPAADLPREPVYQVRARAYVADFADPRPGVLPDLGTGWRPVRARDLFDKQQFTRVIEAPWRDRGEPNLFHTRVFRGRERNRLDWGRRSHPLLALPGLASDVLSTPQLVGEIARAPAAEGALGSPVTVC